VTVKVGEKYKVTTREHVLLYDVEIVSVHTVSGKVQKRRLGETYRLSVEPFFLSTEEFREQVEYPGTLEPRKR
jgi:hypothetical protein